MAGSSLVIRSPDPVSHAKMDRTSAFLLISIFTVMGRKDRPVCRCIIGSGRPGTCSAS